MSDCSTVYVPVQVIEPPTGMVRPLVLLAGIGGAVGGLVRRRVGDNDAGERRVAGVEDLDLVGDDVAGRVHQERRHVVSVHGL